MDEYEASSQTVRSNVLEKRVSFLKTRVTRDVSDLIVGVVSLVESSGSDRSSYYPVVRFTDADGSEVRFKDDFGSNPPSYSVGEAVTVLYVRGGAAHDAMIDRGLWNWLPTALLALFGSVHVFAGLRGLTRQSD